MGHCSRRLYDVPPEGTGCICEELSGVDAVAVVLVLAPLTKAKARSIVRQIEKGNCTLLRSSVVKAADVCPTHKKKMGKKKGVAKS